MTAASHYATKRAQKARGLRTGWCNLSWSLDTEQGRASHNRCTFVTCVCACHDRTEETTVTATTTEAPTEFASGLVFDMDDETYHADPVPGGSLSSTFVRLLTNHVPAKAETIRRNRKPTKAMNLGKAAHAHALGAGPKLITWEYDGRTKEGKAERAALAPLLATEAAVAVTEKEREQIVGMVAALRAHPEVVAILDAAKAEVSAFWEEPGETDVWCRARYDLLTDDRAYDYKTAQDVTRRGFSKTLAAYGYHQQADFYLRGLRALGHPAGAHPMQFICQETEAPYLVQIHTPDDEAMWAAGALNDRAIRNYAECKRTGIWPGYDDLFAEPTPLPPYYFNDHEDALEIQVA